MMGSNFDTRRTKSGDQESTDGEDGDCVGRGGEEGISREVCFYGGASQHSLRHPRVVEVSGDFLPKHVYDPSG